MAIVAKYTSQLIVMQTPEYAGEIRAWAAKVPDATLSNLLREALDSGWYKVRNRLRAEHGELSPLELWEGMHASVPTNVRKHWEKSHPKPTRTAVTS